MKKIFFVAIFLLNLTSLVAQRFVVIEKNDASKSVFDMDDQFSLMGILNNNIGALKDYLKYPDANNNLRLGLKEGSEMKEFESIRGDFEKLIVQKNFKIPRLSDPEDTIYLVKTGQTLQAFLDSAIASDSDYGYLLMLEREELNKWWEAANVGTIVNTRTEKQFCVKEIDLILIQINEPESYDSKTVHFCRSVQEGGKKQVVFSILMWELLSMINDDNGYNEGFNTLFKLSAPLSKELYDNFRKKQFDAYGDCANVCYFGEDFNDFASLPEESKLMEQFDKGPTPIFEKEYRCKEQIGEVLKFARWSDPEDSIIVVRTNQTLQVFLDSALATDSDYESFLAIPSDELNGWWEQTKINDFVRKDIQEMIYWRDIEEPNAYALMAWSDGKNVVKNLLFTKENKATSKQSIILNFDSYNATELKIKGIPSPKFDQLPWVKTMINSKGKKFSLVKKNNKELTTYSYLIEEIIKNSNP